VTNNLVPAWNAKPNKALVDADKDLSAANMSIAQAEADLQAAIANIQTFNDNVKNAPAMVPDASGKMVEVAAFAADAQEKSAQFRKQAADDCADMETIRTWFGNDAVPVLRTSSPGVRQRRCPAALVHTDGSAYSRLRLQRSVRSRALLHRVCRWRLGPGSRQRQ
jgi:hypothetical protein